MADDLNFTPDDWANMPVSQRIGLCRRLALRARELGKRAHPDHAAAYLRIADEWDKLGAEMERNP